MLRRMCCYSFSLSLHSALFVSLCVQLFVLLRRLVAFMHDAFTFSCASAPVIPFVARALLSCFCCCDAVPSPPFILHDSIFTPPNVSSNPPPSRSTLPAPPAAARTAPTAASTPTFARPPTSRSSPLRRPSKCPRQLAARARLLPVWARVQLLEVKSLCMNWVVFLQCYK